MNPESINFKTVYKKVRSMPPKLRKNAVSGREGEHWLSLLTPTQFAMLFPDYFKKALPDVGLTQAASGATVMGGRSPTVTSALPWSGESSSGGGRVSTGGSGSSGTSTATPSASPPPDPNKVMEDKLKAEGIVFPEPDPTPGGHAVIAEARQRMFAELDADPSLKATVQALVMAENGAHPEGPLESLMNRAAMTGKSIKEHVYDGFYGPINRGQVSPLTNKDAIAKADSAFERVKGGSNDIGLRTDQGMVNEHKWADSVAHQGRGRKEKIHGEYYSDKGPQGEKWKASIDQRIAEYDEQKAKENRTGSTEPTGLTPGSPKPGKELTKPEGMNDELSKYFDSLSHAKQQALLQQFDKLGLEKVNKLAEESFAKNKVTALSTQGTEFVHELQGEVAATRKGALQSDLKEKLQYAAEQAGVQVEVVSGGQRMPGAPGAVGSTRHDDGGAADLKLFQVDKDGNKRYLDMRNPEDRTLMKKFAKESVKAGATGIGAGMGYMGANTMHIGGGRSTHWGGADFIGEAHSEGTAERNLGDFEKWKEMKQSATPVVGSETGSTRPTGLTPGSADPNAPVPLKDRGITTQSGHTAPSTSTPPAPTPNAANPRAPGYTPPAVTPVPAPTPPATTPPAAETPGDAGRDLQLEMKDGKVQNQSSAPQPKAPVQTSQMEAGTKVAERTVSEKRAYDRSNFSEKHYEGGAANVMKA